MIAFRKTPLVASALCCLIGGHLSAQNQHEMNQQAAADFEKADAQLNRVYKKVLAEMDAEAQAKLKTAQRAWIVFRDAEAEYEADQEARGGSMYPMCFSVYSADLTRQRIKQLRGQTKDSR